jgi:hypothetical protein
MTIRFVHRPERDPAVERLLVSLREVLPHGGALFAAFDVVDAPYPAWVFEFLPTGDRVNLDPFLHSSALAATLPELELDRAWWDELRWDSEDLFIAEARLISLLYYGGPYGTFPGTATEARRLVEAFSFALFEDRYRRGEVHVLMSQSNWTPWFQGDWDHTWVWCDATRARVYLLCATDYD